MAIFTIVKCICQANAQAKKHGNVQLLVGERIYATTLSQVSHQFQTSTKQLTKDATPEHDAFKFDYSDKSDTSMKLKHPDPASQIFDGDRLKMVVR